MLYQEPIGFKITKYKDYLKIEIPKDSLDDLIRRLIYARREAHDKYKKWEDVPDTLAVFEKIETIRFEKKDCTWLESD